MQGLHISMMSAHRDRQQNPRTPHCLIRMGNINLINPPRFPVTGLLAPPPGTAPIPARRAPLRGPTCLCPWLQGPQALTCHLKGSMPGGRLEEESFLPSHKCRGIPGFCAPAFTWGGAGCGSDSEYRRCRVGRVRGDPASHVCRYGHSPSVHDSFWGRGALLGDTERTLGCPSGWLCLDGPQSRRAQTEPGMEPEPQGEELRSNKQALLSSLDHSVLGPAETTPLPPQENY